MKMEGIINMINDGAMAALLIMGITIIAMAISLALEEKK